METTVSVRNKKVSGTPRRLTFGTDQVGKVTGEILRVTRDLSTEVFPSISKNRRLAFSSDRSGKREIWVKDLAVNANNKVAFSPSEFDSPKITPDGSKVAYAVSSPEWAIHIVSASGGDEKVYKKGGPPRDFSADGSKLLFEAKSCSPYCVGLLDLAEGTTRELIKDSRLALYPESFSPDTQWIAFQARPVDNDAARTIYVTPFRDGAAGGRETWIPVTNGTEMDREVRWSPGGALLYFLSERDGFRCIWAQRLDRQTKQPTGAAFPVYHFHHSQQSLTSIGSAGKVGLSITTGALMFSLAETTGNIWMARRRR